MDWKIRLLSFKWKSASSKVRSGLRMQHPTRPVEPTQPPPPANCRTPAIAVSRLCFCLLPRVHHLPSDSHHYLQNLTGSARSTEPKLAPGPGHPIRIVGMVISQSSGWLVNNSGRISCVPSSQPVKADKRCTCLVLQELGRKEHRAPL